ncbi:uncharacterized protein F58A4.6 isoform X2 [Diachasma alloeum]|uniref:uncharacterized protein F58A4.6 isoform X2 n=1 Tax=Diachasma alloeum TaxID=454923 RepID=UPI0007382D99|nr:uncharacterized protein F58A4.6 isoform X2 [Diachasma alloeum]
MDLRLIVHSRKSVYDDVVISRDCVVNYAGGESPGKRVRVRMNRKGFSGDVASAYVHLLRSSGVYRASAIRPLHELTWGAVQDGKEPVVFMRLRMPRKQFLDYNWGERVTQMAMERREIDYALSWLSTLGGAFSAMGDHFAHCAQIAGKISIQQFKLALRLGDPLLVARCKLFAALSLIQQNKLKIPRQIIPEIYNYAVDNKDTHLKKMCQGIWAKLKYHYFLEKSNKRVHRSILKLFK